MAVLYRASVLGRALQSALDEMIREETLPPGFSDHVFAKFDAVVAERLSSISMPASSSKSRLQGRILEVASQAPARPAAVQCATEYTGPPACRVS